MGLKIRVSLKKSNPWELRWNVKFRYKYYKEGCIIRHQSLGAAEMTIETILQPLPKAALHKRLQPTNLHMI